uniref:RING-type E3 ubiquitin transferase n=2 Tax=Lutzomyia longipalpis TaxID=7200 RepID=A0A1B0CHF1_LUTLO
MEIICSESGRTSSSRSSSGSDCSKRDCYVSLKHYDCLLGELRCPGCARPMHAPILLCQSGHSVCQECVRVQKWCPLCGQEFTEIRSMTLEALSAKAYFACKNTLYGCTVRLPYDLMKWHKPRCLYQTGSCFMGTIWSGCSWHGRKMDYHDHCATVHAERFFNVPEAELSWMCSVAAAAPKDAPTKSVVGVYMFSTFEEVFDLYHVYDRTGAQCLWTMICESKERKISNSFAFQIELFCLKDPSRLLIQRHSCHGERDDDLLDEAHCVSISMGDIMRFTGDDKKVHYRIKILDLRDCQPTQANPQSAPLAICESCAPDEGTPAGIECTNLKCVPMSNIITKKSSRKLQKNKMAAEKSSRYVNGTATEITTRASPDGSLASLDFAEDQILIKNATQVNVVKTKTIDVSKRDLKGIFDREFQSLKIK